MPPSYYAPKGGHPGQDQLLTDRAVFTDAYAVIPKGSMRDIVTSFLPFWDKTRLWVIARPLSGFAETFSQYIMEVSPGGGSDSPELDPEAEGVLFIVEGSASLTIAGTDYAMAEGGYAYIPPNTDWSLHNTSDDMLRDALRQRLRSRATPGSTRILRLSFVGQSARHWQILRDQDLWAETARAMAQETGQIWIDKVIFDLTTTAASTNSATDELAQIMQAMRNGPGIADRLNSILEATLAELPAQMRAALSPDQDALTALTQDLTTRGTAQMIALMKGASD